MPLNNPGVSGPSIVTSNYTGNASDAIRQITTGFKCSLVIVGSGSNPALEDVGIVFGSTIAIHFRTPDNTLQLTTGDNFLVLHATDGFNVGGDVNNRLNESGKFYWYWAISE